jgi:hypothetical protein
MSSDLLFEKNLPLPISPANCLKMVNENLTRAARGQLAPPALHGGTVGDPPAP